MSVGLVITFLIVGIFFTGISIFSICINNHNNDAYDIIHLIVTLIFGLGLIWLSGRGNGMNSTKSNIRHDFKVGTNEPYKMKITQINGNKDTVFYFKKGKVVD